MGVCGACLVFAVYRSCRSSISARCEIMSATNILKFSPLPMPCEIRGTAANRTVKQDKGTAG